MHPAPARAKPAELTVAVVVCTSSRRRVALVRDCVSALLAGERKPDELIVVVDNNRSLAAELRGLLPSQVRLLETSRQGLSGARNLGLARCRSDVVAFVDDDATVDAGWLSTVMDAFADRQTLAVGGPVVPRWGGERRWMCDALLWVVGCTYSGHREDAGPIRNPIGCNMAFRRLELVALGSFATSFGKRGNALQTCDETELGLRLERAYGPGRIRYVPDACVHHFVPPARVSWRHLLRRSLAEGLAKGRLQRIYRLAAVEPERGYARLLVTATVPRLLLDGVRRRDRQSALGAAAILASLLVTAAGFAAGLAREGPRRGLSAFDQRERTSADAPR
jgi:glycosyltransferase involved in cell wall biosynthesis